MPNVLNQHLTSSTTQFLFVSVFQRYLRFAKILNDLLCLVMLQFSFSFSHDMWLPKPIQFQGQHSDTACRMVPGFGTLSQASDGPTTRRVSTLKTWRYEWKSSLLGLYFISTRITCLILSEYLSTQDSCFSQSHLETLYKIVNFVQTG